MYTLVIEVKFETKEEALDFGDMVMHEADKLEIEAVYAVKEDAPREGARDE